MELKKVAGSFITVELNWEEARFIADAVRSADTPEADTVAAVFTGASLSAYMQAASSAEKITLDDLWESDPEPVKINDDAA